LYGKGSGFVVSNNKVTGKSTAVSVGVLFGFLGSMLLTIACTAILAYLISVEKIQEESIGYGAMVTLLISAAFGSWITTVKVKRLRVQVCLISAAAYYLALLGITALFFGGQYQGMGGAVAAVFVGSGAVALVGGKGKKMRKNKKQKRAYC